MNNEVNLNSNQAKLWKAAAIIFINALMIKSCFFGELTAEQTIRKHITHVSNGEIIEALSLMENDTLNIKSISANMHEVARHSSSKGGISKIDVDSPKKKEDAIYSVTVEYKNGETEGPVYLRMVLDDKKEWKIGQTK